MQAGKEPWWNILTEITNELNCISCSRRVLQTLNFCSRYASEQSESLWQLELRYSGINLMSVKHSEYERFCISHKQQEHFCQFCFAISQAVFSIAFGELLLSQLTSPLKCNKSALQKKKKKKTKNRFYVDSLFFSMLTAYRLAFLDACTLSLCFDIMPTLGKCRFQVPGKHICTNFSCFILLVDSKLWRMLVQLTVGKFCCYQ